jgi:hypothetical protein
LILVHAKSPAALRARRLQKYDNRVVPFRLRQGATGILASAAFTLQERGEMLISSVRIKVNARRPPLDLQHYLRIC